MEQAPFVNAATIQATEVDSLCEVEIEELEDKLMPFCICQTSWN